MLRVFLSALAVAFLASALPIPVAAQQTPTPATGGAKKGAANVVVNINTAAVGDLQHLPGIGAKTAARIVEYRQKNGPFKKAEELMNVRGVGEKNFLKLKSLVTVGPAKADHAPQQ
jgi:competence protein ComEA